MIIASVPDHTFLAVVWWLVFFIILWVITVFLLLCSRD